MINIKGFTPGPWEVKDIMNVVSSARGICSNSYGNNSDGSYEESVSNMKLISMAPLMYEVCQAVEKLRKTYEEWQEGRLLNEELKDAQWDLFATLNKLEEAQSED